jgi:homocysteine S-methyltransferase
VQIDRPRDAPTVLRQQLADRAVDAVDINPTAGGSAWTPLTGDECGAPARVVPHITPRDASLMGLQSQPPRLAGGSATRSRSGDPSQLGDYPGVHDVYHVDIFELVRAVSRMAEGFDCAANPIGEPPSFLLGVAVNPNADDLPLEVDRLRRKVDAGAHFAMTQVFFGWEPWERFLELCGGAPPVPTLVAVWPLRSLKSRSAHNEVPGISVPGELLAPSRRRGREAARVGADAHSTFPPSGASLGERRLRDRAVQAVVRRSAPADRDEA